MPENSKYKATKVSHSRHMKWLQNFFRQLWDTFKAALKTFIAENFLRYSASLSYYTIFSLAPLLIITISLCGHIFGKQAMEGKIFTDIRSHVGDIVALQIQQMIQHVATAKASFMANVAGIMGMVFGIISVFTEVQDAFNHIWGLKIIPNLSRKKYLIKRAISLAIFSLIGLLLFLSLMINWLIEIFGNYLIGFFAGASIYIVFAISRIFIVAIVAILFTFMFKYLPDGNVKWKDAIKGALFTSVFFILGKAGIGYFLVYFNVTSMYGAAGSLVILLLWIYYSSVIVYFGATFTKVYAYLFGGKITPRPFALYLEKEELLPNNK